MKKASSGRNRYAKFGNDANLKCCPLVIRLSSTYICQDPRIARAYTAHYSKKSSLLAFVSLGVYPRSRRGAKRTRQVEGRLTHSELDDLVWTFFVPIKTKTLGLCEGSKNVSNSSPILGVVIPRRLAILGTN